MTRHVSLSGVSVRVGRKFYFPFSWYSYCIRLQDSSEEQKSDGSESKPHVSLEAGKKYDNGLRILEGLAASGLRSVRFAREIPGVCQVYANDFDQTAVEFIKKNVEHNNIHDLVTASHSDASLLMYQNRHIQNR